MKLTILLALFLMFNNDVWGAEFPDFESGAVAPQDLEFGDLAWQQSIDEPNLSIYVANVPGTPIQAFRAISTFRADLLQLASIITDLNSFEKWVYGARRVKRLKVEDGQQWCYAENEVPWPYDNRDAVFIQRIVKHNDTSLSILLTSDSSYLPADEDLVRVTRFEGAWHLQETAPHTTQVTWELYVDPSGALPSWLINLMLTNSPKETLLSLHKQDLSLYQRPTSFVLGAKETP